MSSESAELLPCPFCGGAAELKGSVIGCPNKACWGPSLWHFANADDAIAAWNRRTAPSEAMVTEAMVDMVKAPPTGGVRPHKWIPSTLGHGDAICENCHATNRELAALGELEHCSAALAASAPPVEPVAQSIDHHAYRVAHIPEPTVSPAPQGERRKASEPTHRHKKRGTEYVLIGYGKMQAEHWLDGLTAQFSESGPSGFYDDKLTQVGLKRVDMREVAIYRSVSDPTEIWVRPREEFEDGRFEAIIPQSGAGK